MIINTKKGGAGRPAEIFSDADMSAVLLPENVGKAYIFLGTSETYVSGDIYIVEADRNGTA